MTTAVWAHRGSTQAGAAGDRVGDAAPIEPPTPIKENTLEAFGQARRLGADGVELDVRRSADGALVVHHDPVLPGVGAVCETAVRDLPSHVPLLERALEACDGMVVNVEIKNDPDEPGYEPDQSIATDTARAVTDARWRDRVVVSSFNAETVAAVRAVEPSLDCGLLVGFAEPTSGALDQVLARGFSAVHPFFSFVDKALVNRAHEAGVAVNVWTVDTRSDVEAMVALGVDAVITNDVATALAVTRR